MPASITYRSDDLDDLRKELVHRAGLVECDLSGLTIAGIAAEWVTATHCRFVGANLMFWDAAYFNGSYSSFVGATFENCVFRAGSFTHSDMQRCIFRNCDLSTVDFEDANLTGATFENCNLERATFGIADLRFTDWTNSTIDGAEFTPDNFGKCAPRWPGNGRPRDGEDFGARWGGKDDRPLTTGMVVFLPSVEGSGWFFQTHQDGDRISFAASANTAEDAEDAVGNAAYRASVDCACHDEHDKHDDCEGCDDCADGDCDHPHCACDCYDIPEITRNAEVLEAWKNRYSAD